jgi:hypothetical protein
MELGGWIGNVLLPFGRPHDARYPAALQAWLSWDAQHYLQIARHGYPASPDSNAGFFPLLPLLLHLVGAYEGAALLLAFAFGLCGLAVLTGLTAALYGEQVASRTAWVAAWWPLGFVWSAVYSEGIFLALAAGAIWAAWRGRAWLAAALAFGAALSRPTGMFLIVPVLILLPGTWRRLLAAAPLAGIGAFSLYMRVRTGDFLAYWHAQMAPHMHPFNPWHPWIAVQDALAVRPFEKHWLEAAVGLTLLVLVAVLMLEIRRLPRWRLPALAIVAAFLAPALLAGTLWSFGRYAMVAFPLYWTLQRARTPFLVAGLAPAAVVITALAGSAQLTP